MTQSISRRLTATSVLITALLLGSVAHAAPFERQYTIADAGRWAKAWSDIRASNCTAGSANVPICNIVDAKVTGRVLDAEIQAVHGQANVRRRTDHANRWLWEWGYSIRLFGKTLVSSMGTAFEAGIAANALIGQPAITHWAPFSQANSVSVTVNMGEINDFLSVMGNESFLVHYSVLGGISARVDIAPFTIYGPLATATVQPRAEMVANAGKNWNAVIGSVYVGTDNQNIQVIAPNSDVKFVAGVVGATRAVTITASPNVRLLRGNALWRVKVAGITVADGTIWNASDYFFKDQRPNAAIQLWSGVI